MIKMKILILSLFVFAFAVSASPLSIRMDIRAQSGTLAPRSKGVRFASWLKEKQETTLICTENFTGEEWKTCTFSFVPARSGNVVLQLRGPFAKKDAQWVLYRNIRWNGKLLPNGDFSRGLSDWNVRKTAGGMAALVEDPALSPAGRSIRVWHDGFLSREIPVEAGRTVTLQVDACPTPAFTAFDGFIPLSLRKFANRDYADETEGDGKGGWSDQGREKDLRNFDTARRQFAGIRFDLINPKQNNGKAVVVLDSGYAPTGLREIAFDVPEKAKYTRFLYLLHTGCWVPGKPVPIGTIEFETRDGKRKETRLVAGTDLQDWTRPSSTRNTLAVSVGSYAGEQRAVFLSKFPVPLENVRKIRLRSAGQVCWILCGATLTDQEVTWNLKSFVPGPEYKAADLSPFPVTKPGSALDFSEMSGNLPAGSYGRVVPASQGHLEFEKRPGQPLRFRAAYHFTAEWGLLSSIRRKSAAELKQMIDAYIRELRMRGYNMVRTHTIEQILMLDAPAKGEPDPRFADAVDYCLARLKENGIYLNLNIAAYQFLYPFKVTNSSRPADIKPKMVFGDEKTRQEWLDTARYLLCHKNRYTGMALKDDPMLVCVEPFNELGMVGPQRVYAKEETAIWVGQQFRNYLRRTRPGVDESLIPKKPNEVNGGKFREEWMRFCIESLRETGAWMKARVRELGCNVPVGQYNLSPARFYGDIRSEQNEVIIRNAYFCHPSGSITRQQSATENAVSHFLNTASSRLADRPMIVTEYNHVRNRYEYEQLLFPAYAAFQDYAGLTLHAVILNPTWKVDREMNTYLDLMSEYLSLFAFQRGDVSPSRNLVELLVPKSSLYAKGTDSAISTEQTRWSLLTRFAVRYEGCKPPAEVIAPAPVPVMTFPLTGYAKVGGSAMFTETGVTQGAKFDPKPWIAALRTRGILSKNNQTDPEKGIWESDTGELLLNTREKRFLLRTPRLEAVVSDRNHGESLPVLAKVRSSVPSTVALASRDGKVLAKNSERMLLFYLTDNVNTGMELSPDRTELRKQGKTPTLLRTGQLELQLNLPTGKRYRLYPLRSDGLRREGIPLTKSGSGYRLELDTAALPHGPTGVFELVAEP